MTEIENELIHEVEQLILHAEEGSLDYSVLEHARKLVFRITHPNEYAASNKCTVCGGVYEHNFNCPLNKLWE